MNGLLNNVPCGIARLDGEGVITVANATLADMLGVAVDNLVGRAIVAFMDPASRVFHRTHTEPLLKMQGVVSEVFLRLTAAEGEAVPVVVNARRHEADRGVFVDCAIFAAPQRVRYEDELVQARRDAEEAARAKERFLSTMSHEFRTPLNAIIGFSDLLRGGHAGAITDEQATQLGYVHDAGRYLNTLVNDILGYTRMGVTDLAISPTRLPVETALERAEALVGHAFSEAGVRYTRVDTDRPLRVMADPDRLQQVLVNLLGNAAKFTPPGGEVTTRCEARKSRLLIHVSDTGPGVPEAERGRIFQPFTQLNREDGGAGRRGVGLGLAISRELVLAMEGDLTVDGAPGDGATFTLSLPLAVD